MTLDFSELNHQYLFHIHKMIHQNPAVGTVVFGLSEELATLLAGMTAAQFAKLPQIPFPLFVPCQNAQWWSRFLQSLQDGHLEEIQAMTQHVSLVMASQGDNA